MSALFNGRHYCKIALRDTLRVLEDVVWPTATVYPTAEFLGAGRLAK
jgi:hypothetical protein